MISLIRLYQWLVSPLIGNRCRFYPSCSHYALEAIHRRGPIQGGWLTLKRLCRCHPLHPGGVDMVPGTETTPYQQHESNESHG